MEVAVGLMLVTCSKCDRELEFGGLEFNGDESAETPIESSDFAGRGSCAVDSNCSEIVEGETKGSSEVEVAVGLMLVTSSKCDRDLEFCGGGFNGNESAETS